MHKSALLSHLNQIVGLLLYFYFITWNIVLTSVYITDNNNILTSDYVYELSKIKTMVIKDSVRIAWNGELHFP